MLYKTLDANGRSCYGGNTRWSLPTRNANGTWTPGEWMPAIVGKLVACENGYHLAEDAQVLEWLNERLFVAETRGERIDADNKIIVREVRLTREVTTWNARTQRLFAVWCAREALRLVDRPDQRSLAACDVAARFANGEASAEELAAAWDAARAAAGDAAWAAAGDAAWAAAWAAAWDAAMAAARAAAWAAAGAAAGDAAWDAAGDAAWAAAVNAARAAAGDAAWDAAWAAARAAAWAAQYRQLLAMLGGDA
jgi:hypothetical protein